MKQNTLAFLKGVHQIPRNQKVSWALIPVEGTPNYDLGVFLIGTDKVLNIKTGRFEQAERTLIAMRRSKGDWYEYSANNVVRRMPKSYVSDMYYDRIYSKEMVDSYLL